jgi:hypothetical protein
MKRILTTILLVLFFGANAQCPNPEKFVKVSRRDNSGFVNNSQSRSGFVRVGEVFETVFVVQDGSDYRLKINPLNEDAGTIKYEIYEMVVRKKKENGRYVFKKVKQVLFSSAEDQPIEIISDGVRKIYVKIMLDGEDKNKIECVGILVQHRRAQKVGF